MSMSCRRPVSEVMFMPSAPGYGVDVDPPHRAFEQEHALPRLSHLHRRSRESCHFSAFAQTRPSVPGVRREVRSRGTPPTHKKRLYEALRCIFTLVVRLDSSCTSQQRQDARTIHLQSQR